MIYQSGPIAECARSGFPRRQQLSHGGSVAVWWLGFLRMHEIHTGPTLAPHFRDFLPPWVARQPWYAGSETRPALSPVGFFRFEDPAGQVGMETHLLADGSHLYQIPMTFRDAPLPGESPQGVTPLITTAQHSVLGTRWIYDAEADPVWRGEMLRLIEGNGVSAPSLMKGAAPAQARGHRLPQQELKPDKVVLELIRLVVVSHAPSRPDLAGVVMGIWHPHGPDAPAVTGCLALAYEAFEPQTRYALKPAPSPSSVASAEIGG